VLDWRERRVVVYSEYLKSVDAILILLREKRTRVVEMLGESTVSLQPVNAPAPTTVLHANASDVLIANARAKDQERLERWRRPAIHRLSNTSHQGIDSGRSTQSHSR
jgi:hypothetical protein